MHVSNDEYFCKKSNFLFDVSGFAPNLRYQIDFENKLLDISGFETKSCNMSAVKPIN
jgi:hypothetical protein